LFNRGGGGGGYRWNFVPDKKEKTHAALFSEASENTFRIADSRCNLLFEFLLFSIA
jgi:hypothetical protein